MKNVDKVIVHCTATPEGRHTTVEDVRRWHHRDFASKACPSFDAKKEYSNITNMWK